MSEFIILMLIAVALLGIIFNFLLMLVLITAGLFMSPEKVCDAAKVYLPFLYTKLSVAQARQRWERQDYAEDY